MHVVLIYLGIFFGMFIEGEIILISSIIAAHHGYLNLWLVIILAATGTFSADCFYFTIGRKKGKEWINKKPGVRNKTMMVNKKIEKFPVLIFIIYRFFYGIKAITPMLIGSGEIRIGRFLLFSALSTTIWSTTYSTIGYLFGSVIQSKLGHIEHIEKYIIGALIFIGIIIIVSNKILKRKRRYNAS